MGRVVAQFRHLVSIRNLVNLPYILDFFLLNPRFFEKLIFCVILYFQVAKALNCPLNSRGDELVECLKSKSTEDLLGVQLQRPPFTTPLGPIVDGTIIKKNPLT